MNTVASHLLVGITAFVKLNAAIVEKSIYPNSGSLVRLETAVSDFYDCLRDSAGVFIDYEETRTMTLLHSVVDPTAILTELSVACGIYLFVMFARRGTQEMQSLAVLLVSFLWVVPEFVLVTDVADAIRIGVMFGLLMGIIGVLCF
jgi:hypothetical protein